MQLFIHSNKILFILITVMLSCHVTFAGGFSPNVQVNPDKEGRINLWGGNTIGVHGENIYVLWTDFNQQVSPPHSHTYVSRSTDGGVTISGGVRVDVDSDQFFSAMTVDNAGRVYVVWTDVIAEEGLINGISFARSTDGAETFSDPVVISADGIFPVVAVDGDNVYILFISRENEQFQILFSRSTDGGSTFEEPYNIADAPIPDIEMERGPDILLDSQGNIYCVWNDGRRGGDGTDIYLAKSTDKGVSFGENIPVSNVAAPNNRAQFSSAGAVYGTNVYVAWLEEDANEERRILYAKSEDGGATFGDEKELVTVSWGSPALTVNDEGVIYLVYPDFQPSPPFPTYREGLFLLASMDQGDSFPVTVFVSDQNSAANNPSLTIDENNIIYAVWTDDRSGEYNVYFSKASIGPPAAFNLLEPSDGMHYTFTEAATMFNLRWEDVLNLDDNGENQTGYYLFRPVLDPHLMMVIEEDEDDHTTKPYEEVRAGELGFLFALYEYRLGEAPDTLDLYWTIAAVNEWGTTWANDTFHVSFEIDNDPPVDGFHLLEPGDDVVVEIVVHGDTYIPVDDEITFTWNPTTDPDGDEVRYIWLMSDVYPLPDIYDEEFNENYVDDGSMFLLYPSGRIDDDDLDWWELGGVETHMVVPHEVVYNWFLGGQMEEKSFYWTVIATDGFHFYHWVPSADTLKVTFKPVTTSAQELHVDIPEAFYLEQNYPNPFNPVTTIGFALPVASNVQLEISNILGQRVATLIEGDHLSAGTYEITWDGRDYTGREVSSGVYIYSLTAGDNVQYRRMIMMK